MNLLPAFTIISSADIVEGDLLAWLRPLGVEHGTQDQLFPHTIQRGADKLWFSAPEAIHGLEPGGENEAQAAQYAMTLGTPPRTRIEAFYGRSEGSRQLAIEFALRLGERWPSMVENERNEMLLSTELRARYAADPASTNLANLSGPASPGSDKV